MLQKWSKGGEGFEDHLWVIKGWLSIWLMFEVGTSMNFSNPRWLTVYRGGDRMHFETSAGLRVFKGTSIWISCQLVSIFCVCCMYVLYLDCNVLMWINCDILGNLLELLVICTCTAITCNRRVLSKDPGIWGLHLCAVSKEPPKKAQLSFHKIASH